MFKFELCLVFLIVSFLLLHMKRVMCAFLNRYRLLVNLSSGFVVIPFVLRPYSSKVSFIPFSAISIDCWTSPCTVEPHLALLNLSLHCWTSPCTVEPHLALLNLTSHCWTSTCTVEPHLALLNHTLHCWTSPCTVEPHLALLNLNLHCWTSTCTVEPQLALLNLTLHCWTSTRTPREENAQNTALRWNVWKCHFGCFGCQRWVCELQLVVFDWFV